MSTKEAKFVEPAQKIFPIARKAAKWVFVLGLAVGAWAMWSSDWSKVGGRTETQIKPNPTATAMAESRGGRQGQNPVRATPWQEKTVGTSPDRLAVLITEPGTVLEWNAKRPGCIAAYMKERPDDPDYKEELELLCAPGVTPACWKQVFGEKPMPDTKFKTRHLDRSRIRLISVDCQENTILWQIRRS